MSAPAASIISTAPEPHHPRKVSQIQAQSGELVALKAHQEALPYAVEHWLRLQAIKDRPSDHWVFSDPERKPV